MRYLAILAGVGTAVLLLAAAFWDFPSPQTLRADDDHSDYRSAATPLGIGTGVISGNIDETALFFDVDYFTFDTRRGVRYTFTVDMGTVTDANILVINSSDRGAGVAEGQTVYWDGRQKNVEWVARTGDTYYLEVFGAQGTPDGPVFLGDYTLSATADSMLEDRHAESMEEATSIAIGNQYQGSVSPWPSQPMYAGSIEEDYDHDYFSFSANRGVKYTIGVDLDTLQAVEIAIGNWTGTVADSNGGVGSTLEWIAPATGGYYVSLSGSALVREPVGTYTLEVTADLSLEDRHSGSRDGATPINFGNQHQGAISPADDRDYFFFQAVRGVKYQVDVDLTTHEGAEISISDQAGKSEASNGGVGSSLEWIAPSTANYYIVVSGSPLVRSPVGAYVLEVTTDESLQDRHSDTREDATLVYFGTPQGGSISPAEDMDFFHFPATRGVKYGLEVELGTAQGVNLSIIRSEDGTEAASSSGGTALEWIAPLTETYFVIVTASTRTHDVIGTYSLELTADMTLEDQHSDTRDGATAIRMGTTQQGSLSPGDDQDFFVFDARRGVEYEIQVDSGSYAGINIAVARTLEGVEISNNGLGNRVKWIAPDDARYYVVVSTPDLPINPVGPYSLKATANNALEDQHGEGQQDATMMNFGTVYLGAVSPEDDVDYFSFKARRGVRYHLDAGPDAVVAIVIEHASSGSTDGIEQINEASNESLGSTLDWTATGDGTYFVAISRSNRVAAGVGTYALEITGDITTEDRHSSLIANATPITFGNRVSGAISPPDDRDLFSFQTTRGIEYTFELTYGTAEAVSLTVVKKGATQGFSASNYGEDSTVAWLSPSDGTYFITVSAAPQLDDPVGTYFLKVIADSSLQDRHANDISEATRIGFGNTISGSISPADDTDTFSFTAERGETYLVEVQAGLDHGTRFWVTNPSASFTESNYGAGGALMVTVPVSGAYYIIVSAADPSQGAVNKYEVTVTLDEFSPAIDPEEGQSNGANAAGLGLTLSVENRVAPRGGVVRVPIMMANALDVSGLAFSLGYDPSVLEVVAVEQGSRLAPATFTYSDQDPGVVRFGFASQEPITGGGSAAVVVFKVIGGQEGASLLTLTRSLVSDAYSRPLSIELSGGELTIGARLTGDADGDGAATALDALIAMKMARQLIPVDLALDIDGDGQVTVNDARLILAMGGLEREV